MLAKRSRAIWRTMPDHAKAQHAVADMVIELESIGPHWTGLPKACATMGTGIYKSYAE